MKRSSQVPADVQSNPAPEPAGGLLQEAQIKLSSLVSDLLALSARRMLQALADSETIGACAQPPTNSVTRSALYRTYIRSTVGC
jgi:hypothetical protein